MDRTTKILLGIGVCLWHAIVLGVGVLAGVLLAATQVERPVAEPPPVRYPTVAEIEDRRVGTVKESDRASVRAALAVLKANIREEEARVAREQLESGGVESDLPPLSAADEEFRRRRLAEAARMDAADAQYEADMAEDDRRELAGKPRIKTPNQPFSAVDPQVVPKSIEPKPCDPFAP